MPGARIQIVVGLTGRRGAAAGQPDRYAWRMLGGNNREHARSTEEFADQAQLMAALGALRTGISDGLVTAAVDLADRHWTWRVDLDGQRRIRSPRGHLRRIDAEEGLRRCLAILPLAPVSPVLLDNRRPVVRHGGAVTPRGLTRVVHGRPEESLEHPPAGEESTAAQR